MSPDERACFRIERVLHTREHVQEALSRGKPLEYTSPVLPPAPRDLFTASEMCAFLSHPDNAHLNFRITTVDLP